MTAPHHSSSNRWFESLSTVRAPLRLFCFPYAGGSAHVFREWQRHLGPEIDVCLVHLPGRARRLSERPYTQVRPLVEDVAGAIRTEIRGPFAFYGHSMGGLISFELARELRRRNAALPMHLFISGCWAPSVANMHPPAFNLPEQELIAELKKLNGTPKEFFENPDLRQAILPMMRADFEITDMYEYLAEPPLACGINVYGGTQDERVRPQDLTQWKLETSADCKIQLFSGDHFFIHNNKTEFIPALRQDLLQTLPVASGQP